MKYHIKNQAGDIIASFEHEDDRDVCFAVFEDYYEGECILERVDD